MINTIDKGAAGETIAKKYLITQGYSILAVNWRTKHLEIDIVAHINHTLVIVEVKLRASDFFGTPEEFVTLPKQKKIIKAANVYIKQNNIDWETRFDIVSIIQSPNEFKLNHLQNAFYPTL